MWEKSTRIRIRSFNSPVTAAAVMVRGRVPHSQCRHDAIGAQSAPYVVRCKQSAGRCGRRRGRRCWRRRREWRSPRRRRGHALRLFRLFRPQHFALGLRRRAGRLKFRDHWIGIDHGRGRGREIAGDSGHLHRHGNRLEPVERVRDRETTLWSRYGEGARRFAAGPQGGSGLSSRWNRLQLDLHHRLRWLERVEGK
jgi:hypothetical protein